MMDDSPEEFRRFVDFLTELKDRVYKALALLSVTAWITDEPVPWNRRESGKKIALQPGDPWGTLFQCGWFHFTGSVPETAAGLPVDLLIDVSGEMAILDMEQVPIRGLTSVTSKFSEELGSPGKRVVHITESAEGGEEIDLWGEAGCNDLFGELIYGGHLREAHIVSRNEELRQFTFDFEVVLDLLMAMEGENRLTLRDVLETVVLEIRKEEFSGESILHGRNRLAPLFMGSSVVQDGAAQNGLFTIGALGHGHMDLAWLWPIRETVRKVSRTFATVLDHMARYDEFVFGASQAQQFQFMKETYPKLYERIKERVGEGRLEILGAMWVEPDANLPSGESLIRQILHGVQFFRNEFQTVPEFLWLPDTFGFPASLPQLMKLGGMKWFASQKLSWNVHNEFPYHSFRWKGIDGTEIPSHFFPENTYNGPALPRSVMKIKNNYKEKNLSSTALMVYGIGDGGGGPGAEHIERLKRLGGLFKDCTVVPERVLDFHQRWARDIPKLPIWEGELYLERHQGTFTTIALQKQNNRRMERGLYTAEALTVLASSIPESVVSSGSKPRDTSPRRSQIHRLWEETLLYQFHDILPGSSIQRVYRENAIRYREMLNELDSLRDDLLNDLGAHAGSFESGTHCLVVNTLGWSRKEWRLLGNTWRLIEVPPFGFALLEDESLGGKPSGNNPEFLGEAAKGSAGYFGIRAEVVEEPASSGTMGRVLENNQLKIRFGADGSITSVVLKADGREYLESPGNLYQVYKDAGDAWDLKYREHLAEAMILVGDEMHTEGPNALLRQSWKYGDSILKVEIILTACLPYVLFRVRIDWKDPGRILKTAFPSAVHSTHADCGIQFGSIARPTTSTTSRDAAMDEIPAQGWVDVSHGHRGLALLCDGKYGYCVKNNRLEISLHRSVPYTGPEGREGSYSGLEEVDFEYALLPHRGDFSTAGLHRRHRELANPLILSPAGKTPSKSTSGQFSLFECSQEAVIPEYIKPVESGFILRLFESSGNEAECTVSFNISVKEAYEVSLLEEITGSIPLTDSFIQLKFHPFEIKSILIQPG